MLVLGTQHIVVIQSVNCGQLFTTPRFAAYQASLSSAVSRSLLTCMSTESVKLSIHLTLCCPLLLLPSIFPSIRVYADMSRHSDSVFLYVTLQNDHRNVLLPHTIGEGNGNPLQDSCLDNPMDRGA